MSSQYPVTIGGTTFYIQADPGMNGGPVGPVGLDEVFSFENVRGAVEGIATELRQACTRARPDEASVEFGLGLVVKSGKLSALLVDGSGSASLKVSLTWRASPSDGGEAPTDAPDSDEP
jgi:hypothetical protein